ncbi:MAG: hypothetical protein CML51_05675 [Rhodobacteraceae bacterium]|nr:hypothetical protein [Paracoccaceae bacterium]
MSLWGRLVRRRSSLDAESLDESDRRSVVSEAVSTSSMASSIKARARRFGGPLKQPLPEEKRLEQCKRNQDYQKTQAKFEEQAKALLRSLCKEGTRALDRLNHNHDPDGGDSVSVACLSRGVLLNESCPSKSRLATPEEMRQGSIRHIDPTMAAVCKVCGQKSVGTTSGGNMYVCVLCGVDHGVATVSLAYAGNKTAEEGMLTARGEVIHMDAGKDDMPATSAQEARTHEAKTSQAAYHGVSKEVASMQKTLERRALTQAINLTDPLMLQLTQINKHAQLLCENQTIRMGEVGVENIKALLQLVDADLRRLCKHQQTCMHSKCTMRMHDIKTPMLRLVVNVIVLDWLEMFHTALLKKEELTRNPKEGTLTHLLSEVIPDAKARHYMTDSNILMLKANLRPSSVSQMIKRFVAHAFNNQNMSTINVSTKGPILMVLTNLRKHAVPPCCTNEVTHDLLLCSETDLKTAAVPELQEALEIVSKHKVRAQEESDALKAEHEKLYNGHKQMKAYIEVLSKHGTAMQQIPELMKTANAMHQKAQQVELRLKMADSQYMRHQERYNLINLTLWSKDVHDGSTLLDRQHLDHEQVQQNLFAIADAADALVDKSRKEFDYQVDDDEVSQMVAAMPLASKCQLCQVGQLAGTVDPTAVNPTAVNPTIDSPMGLTHGFSASPPTQANQVHSASSAIDMSAIHYELSNLPTAPQVSSSALMPPPPPMPPTKARKQRFQGEKTEMSVHGSPLKRSRGIATSEEPQPISLHTGLALQASLTSVREQMSAPMTSSSLNPLQQYREANVDTSSVASSEQIPAAYPFARVTSASSVASSCESYVTTTSTISVPTLELPPPHTEEIVVLRLRQVSAFTIGHINSIPLLQSINRAHNTFGQFKKSDEAKAIFYALLNMQSNPEYSFYDQTFNAAYIFFGVVYAYRHGFLSVNETAGAAAIASPSKRSKTNQGLAAVLSYDVAYKHALQWKNTLNKLPFYTNKDYSYFGTAAQNARLL